ncbi:TAXI family TRAP transporter solute-binding subunit [Haloferula sp.]|uniref:TAXI family TRAP transporter solute-binding subunit n=1 Tax=Haloferula sp. TaxID=2497595 RepID=UPI003C781EA3
MIRSHQLRRLLPFLLAGLVLALFILPWLMLVQAQRQSYQLRISTGEAGGLYQPLAAAITEVVSKDHPELTFEQQPSEGSLMSMRRLESGESDLALVQNGTPANEHVRLIAPLYQEVLHILVSVDSPVTSVRELLGKRLAIGSAESGTRMIVSNLLEHYTLGRSELVEGDLSTACEKLLAGEVDAVFAVTGVRARAIRELMAGGKVRLLGIGDPGVPGSEVEGVRIHYPHLMPFVIPAGTYRSDDPERSGRPLEAVQTLALPSLLVCRSELPEHSVAQITRSIFENRVALVQRHPVAAGLREPHPEQLVGISYPLHSGADDFYHRNEPNFFVAYAEVMALILSVAIALLASGAAVRKWLLLRKKDRIDQYYVAIEKIISQLNSENSLSQLQAFEEELSGLRAKAVKELVDERLQANESFRIFQVLLANTQSELRRRIGLL